MSKPVISKHYSETSLQHGGRWQVIFKSMGTDGVVRDYCREQPPMLDTFDAAGEWDARPMTEGEALRWADEQARKHGLFGAELQCF